MSSITFMTELFGPNRFCFDSSAQLLTKHSFDPNLDISPLIHIHYAVSFRLHYFMDMYVVKYTPPSELILYLPTPPLGQDIIQGQFLIEVYQV